MKILGRPASTPPLRYIFDGQSLNKFPPRNDNQYGYSWCYHVMRGRSAPWGEVALGGTAWSTLALTAGPPHNRLFPYLNRADNTILLMCGTTTDILEGDLAATAYADQVAYATAARAVNPDLKIVNMTLIGNGVFTGPQKTQQLAHNALLLADAAGAFDGVADPHAAFEAEYGPTYWANTDLFVDGLHLWLEGTEFYASVINPVVDAVLATL